MNSLITFLLKQEAATLGFDACGVAPVSSLERESAYLRYWLSQQYHAKMNYMANHIEIREDPSLLVANAQSVVMLLMNYRPPQVQDEKLPQVAYYAYGNDYHDIIREKLQSLLDFLKRHIPAITGRCFVDSAPLMEKVWAVRAGLGWRGKNTLLLNPTHGSYTFLGAIVVDAELAYDNAETRSYCGSCTRCIEACPTKALKAPYTIDAGKCIAYHTIENRNDDDDIDTHGYLFGCDICQRVCPWNKKINTHQLPELTPLPEILCYDSDEWLALDEKTFGEIFAKSPLKRAGLAKLKATAARLKARDE